MLAWDESTSMLWARVVRGAASSAKPVTPVAARRCRPGASNGSSMPTTAVPGRSRGSSASEGLRTFRTRSAPKAVAASTVWAPAAA